MLYRHYKGGLYRVMANWATVEATGELVVVYMSVETGEVWTRPYEEFHGEVEITENQLTKRFMEVH